MTTPCWAWSSALAVSANGPRRTSNRHAVIPDSELAPVLSGHLRCADTISGWSSQDRYPRQLADINSDGFADIVGFAQNVVSVALATGTAWFGAETVVTTAFNRSDGWTSKQPHSARCCRCEWRWRSRHHRLRQRRRVPVALDPLIARTRLLHRREAVSEVIHVGLALVGLVADRIHTEGQEFL